MVASAASDVDAELAARWRERIATADPVVAISRPNRSGGVSKFRVWRRESTE